MITVLMGAPGAGKSTWLEKNKTGKEHIYNTQPVRTNSEIDVNRFMAHIRLKAAQALEQGLDVVADGTHTRSDHRSYWLRLAVKHEIDTKLVIFETPLILLMEANARRQYPASYKAITEHHLRRVRSMELVKREGWTTIEIVKRSV